ncbi:hypothetical protein Lesp02_30860 [Lentzea sp. NBRC 105346]|uniref:hypothetical protein n=1 Tax=Lentzea sp. NBRC 105346 TaxID=3032205 RepID=UPI0024A456F9|nr:hypothetical protein [Lentzea sp. NBRC 105346]GLZ30897.1 hypothetical protein Lesp02_30860 [Lentzea sp. NBRC 105346]
MSDEGIDWNDVDLGEVDWMKLIDWKQIETDREIEALLLKLSRVCSGFGQYLTRRLARAQRGDRRTGFSPESEDQLGEALQLVGQLLSECGHVRGRLVAEYRASILDVLRDTNLDKHVNEDVLRKVCCAPDEDRTVVLDELIRTGLVDYWKPHWSVRSGKPKPPVEYWLTAKGRALVTVTISGEGAPECRAIIGGDHE